jgi:hypothetical protein
MAIESRPQLGRPVIGAGEAARILRRDVRTVRRMVESGDLDGGATAGPTKKRWYVYADQIPAALAMATPTQHLPSSPSTGGDEVADLKAEIVTLKEVNRLLTASNALSLAALEDYKAAADGYRKAADGYRASAEGNQAAADGYREAAQKYQSAADGFHGALVHHRDAVAQYTTPGHLGDLSAIRPDPS